jgi:hypothetical protein
MHSRTMRLSDNPALGDLLLSERMLITNWKHEGPLMYDRNRVQLVDLVPREFHERSLYRKVMTECYQPCLDDWVRATLDRKDDTNDR